jgi:hypothetical protein
MYFEKRDLIELLGSLHPFSTGRGQSFTVRAKSHTKKETGVFFEGCQLSA